jgi:hypothetical protein
MICCSKCGAKAKPGCNCGVAYVPAHVFAAKAVAAHPKLSDRAIAEKIGVAPNTVRKARATAQTCAVEKRTGRDGKARKLPSRQMTPEAANAMRARAEAVSRLFPPPVKTVPGESRAELVAALKAYSPPLVETIRKRLNLTWDDLIVPAASDHENSSPVRESPAQRSQRIASAA